MNGAQRPATGLPHVLYAGVVLLIAVVDSVWKESAAYTATNIALRVVVLLPLLFAVARGPSAYARGMRRTLWMVMVADVLLPLFFPAGMLAFLVVHLLNADTFRRYLGFARLRSFVLPAAVAYGVSLLLYAFVLYPAMDDLFRVLVGVYLVPIALAWSLSITLFVQHRSRWALTAAAGMFLFYVTDFQVAAEFLTDIRIPAYGVVNALTYYAGLYLLCLPASWPTGPLAAPR